MARRTGSRTRTVGVDLNKMTHESRAFLLEIGNEAIKRLAELIADKANDNAKNIVCNEEALPGQKIRRGPNKEGKSDSGPISGSIFSQESQKVPNSYLVISPAWYSHFIEYGTEPHEMPRISYKKGKYMHFLGTNNFEGMHISVKKVNHPGIKRHAFLRPAADLADDFVKQIVKEFGLSNKS